MHACNPDYCNSLFGDGIAIPYSYSTTEKDFRKASFAKWEIDFMFVLFILINSY